MKIINRILALMMALMLLCGLATAEDTALRGYDKKAGYVYVILGSFPQTEDGGVEPILWRVLAVEDGRALLLSEYVLEARRIHGDYKEYANKPTNKKNPGFDGDFTQTEMAQYLNGDFAQKNFTIEEQSVISPDETYGMFFLLSGDDLKNKDYGFVDNNSRKAWGTEYAKANGLFVYGSSRGNHSPYWTRTQSTTNTQGARCIKSKGEIGYINVITEDEGMRPACYLDMARVQLTGGSGTLEDPYRLNTDKATDTAMTENIETTECDCVPEGEKCDCCDCCSCSLR
ncbi:MAG: hypothetical protein IJ438_12700 [Clostridia bacterium]|nr:hypothetical protein [Clostridia bacterium]